MIFFVMQRVRKWVCAINPEYADRTMKKSCFYYEEPSLLGQVARSAKCVYMHNRVVSLPAVTTKQSQSLILFCHCQQLRRSNPSR